MSVYYHTNPVCVTVYPPGKGKSTSDLPMAIHLISDKLPLEAIVVVEKAYAEAKIERGRIEWGSVSLLERADYPSPTPLPEPKRGAILVSGRPIGPLAKPDYTLLPAAGLGMAVILTVVLCVAGLIFGAVAINGHYQVEAWKAAGEALRQDPAVLERLEKLRP